MRETDRVNLTDHGVFFVHMELVSASFVAVQLVNPVHFRAPLPFEQMIVFSIPVIGSMHFL